MSTPQQQQTSPATDKILKFLEAQSNLLRQSHFSGSPTRTISAETALSNVGSLKGKVVVVTGAAGIGFGANVAKKMAKHGAKVVLSDLNLEAVQKVVDVIRKSGGEAIGVACNVIDWDAQVRMFRLAIDTYGKVDIVFANAGTSSETNNPLISNEVDQNGEPKKPSILTLDVNTTGAIYTTKLGFYHLSQNPAKEGKAIVILGSMASFFGIPGAPLYTASKHAMLGFMRSLYHNAKSENIVINTIHPFFVQTGIFGFLPLLGLVGIPLATIDDVIAAMIYASTTGRDGKAPCGSAFLVDWKGILEVPYNACAGSLQPLDENGQIVKKQGGSSSLEVGQVKGYYRVFEERAAQAIYSGKVIRDLVYAFKSLIFGPPRRA